MTGCLFVFLLIVFVIGGLLNCLLFFPVGILWGFPMFLIGSAVCLAILKGARA